MLLLLFLLLHGIAAVARVPFPEPVASAAGAVVAAGAVFVGGAVAYASVDADFRKLLEESVPGSDQVTLMTFLRDQLLSAYNPGSRVANWSSRTSPTSPETCSQQVEDSLLCCGYKT